MQSSVEAAGLAQFGVSLKDDAQKQFRTDKDDKLKWSKSGHVNALKTEYMCYNQTGDISTLDRTSLKLVDKFTYLGSSVSSTEKDIDTRLKKAWTAIDRLSIIWKSDLTDKMKHSFFQQWSYRYCYMDALLGR